MSIHRQNKDILFKDLSDHNNDVFLDILNIDDICDIGDIGDKNRSLIELPNEIAIIKSFNKKPDKLYLLGKKVIINLEFESSYKLENIARYMLYASLISYTYSAMSGYKISYPVRTIVVYPGNVKLPTSVYTNTESLHFSITQISLNDVIDGDAILADISKRFREDPNLVLSEKEMVKLVLAPLGKVTGNRQKFSEKTLLLAKSLFNKNDQQRELALVVASTYSFLGQDKLNDLLGGEEEMNELANYITGGKLTKLMADAEKFRADAATATAEIDKIRAENDKFRTEAKREAEKARLIKSVFKMKLDNLDLPTISSYSGLSIEEVEQILS